MSGDDVSMHAKRVGDAKNAVMAIDPVVGVLSEESQLSVHS